MVVVVVVVVVGQVAVRRTRTCSSSDQPVRCTESRVGGPHGAATAMAEDRMSHVLHVSVRRHGKRESSYWCSSVFGTFKIVSACMPHETELHHVCAVACSPVDSLRAPHLRAIIWSRLRRYVRTCFFSRFPRCVPAVIVLRKFVISTGMYRVVMSTPLTTR